MSNSGSISFVLDGELKKLSFNSETGIKPTTTVLNYLRSLDNHKGVKEGCAEGDCGACTVVIASPGSDGGLVYNAVDSCLVFLPAIHGKQVITVENLKHREKGISHLHPVQEKMVTNNGSQCGYCTPGIVMSLFALYKNHHQPSREIILDALTGNLCRCTGYQPIVNAAEQACQFQGKDHFTPSEHQVYNQLQALGKKQTDIILEGKGQQYFLPAALESALSIRELYPDAVITCGATDVALRQTKKMEHLPLILDVSAIRELKVYHETDKDITFGAGLSLEAIKSLSKGSLQALFNMLVVFGSLQIRNMATLGGNIASASPIGDTLPLLFVYGAVVNLAASGGRERSVPVEQFIKGYRQTDLKPGEIITSVTIPKPPSKIHIESYKVSRRKDLDISTVSAAFALQLDDENRVKQVSIVYGGMAARTQRAAAVEAFLQRKPWQYDVVKQAMEQVEQEFTPLSDARSDKEARKIAASNLLLKFYQQTCPR